jgi:hypothetical protein
MANYSNDLDLVKIRSNIMNHNVDDWTEKHTEAKSDIDRAIEKRWYPDAAADQGVDYTETVFDADLLDPDQLTRLSSYKALELIYQFLMKDTPEEDGYSRQMKHFKEKYDEELQALMSYGITYDWGDDGTFDDDDRLTTQRRRIHRA